MRRLLLVLCVILVGLLGVVTAATAAGPGTPLVGPAAAVTYVPASGAGAIDPTTTATVTVQDGTLDEVRLINLVGEPVAGALDADRTGWSTTEPLAYGTTYSWDGTATGADGAVVSLEGSFRTVEPGTVVRGTLNIGDGRTVGVAAPVRIQFDSHVADRAAVERALSVTTSVPVEGAWGWLPDEGGGSRVDYRPRTYWPANTVVTVVADLYGVHYGDGAYGAADLSTTFRIGRAQIVKADTESHRMIVMRDGVQVADYPASYGLTSDTERTTRSGIHVVTEKFTEKRMVSERYGYDTVVEWAVRISNNGEFVHASPDTHDAQGSANVTHGCINLSTADAEEYYGTALYGDPVEVTGTPIELSPRDGDIWDWTLSWEEWQRLSAL